MADAEVTLRWTGEGLRFDGSAPGGPEVRVDGEGTTGPSPMRLLLLSLAGCTAADMVEILRKMRVSLAGLEIRLEGDRAPDPPRRYVRIRMVYETRGVAPADESKLRRAIDLSHETYCSVLHTLRPDVEITNEVVLG